MAAKKYVIGADLGGTTCKLGVFTSDGELLEKWEIKTDRRDNGAYILPNIAEGIGKKLDEMKIKKDDCLGVGIGVPGAVLPGGVVNRCVNLGWDVVPIEAELSKLCGMKVRAANDANIAALGEYWKGGGEGFDSIVMVTLGTGIGGGIVIGGKLLVGQNGAAGEIGHIVVNPEEKIACGCGNHGCIEQYASATGIARAAREELAASEENSVLRNDKGNITAKDVFDAAKAGDGLALILAALHLGILGAFRLDGHISAVIFVYEVFERDIHAPGIAFVPVAVKIVADRDKPGMEQRENALDEIAGFNAVAPEAGEVLDDDAVDLIALHHLYELLHLGPLKVGAAVPVVDKLQDFGVKGLRHGGGVFMENKALILNAQAVVLVILNRKADIKGNHIALHFSSTSPWLSYSL